MKLFSKEELEHKSVDELLKLKNENFNTYIQAIKCANSEEHEKLETIWLKNNRLIVRALLAAD